MVSPELLRLADAVIHPGFRGIEPPDWLRRRLAGGLGGVVLFGRNLRDPEQVAALTAALRAENPDVLISTDEEGGDVTRLEIGTGSSWPGNLALGAVGDPELTRRVAAEIGRDLAACGINLDLAPDADVNSNPDNPVIGVRSFGADPKLVAEHTVAYVTGLQSAGVAACAKHFPGHGDTDVDSHLGLPVVHGDADALERTHLVPFRAAIRAGVQAIMTAHLSVPAYDPAPATVSPRVLTTLLREQLGFDGLVVTDALEMQGVAGPIGLVEAGVRALVAGADALCVGARHGEARTEALRYAIAEAVIAGRLPEERLAEAAERNRRVAAWARTTRIDVSLGPDGTLPGDRSVGREAARRAVRATGITPLATPPVVLELEPEPCMAVGTETAWGIGDLLAARLPGTSVTRLTEAPGDLLALARDDRPLVAVVRDAHRHRWVGETVARLVAARPDTVVVEMGLPRGEPLASAYVATYGAARACALAAVEVLTGRTVDL